MPLSFLSGAIFMASLTVAAHFFRLWRRSGDRLFAFFFAAFVALAAERVVLEVVSPSSGHAPYVYLVRLLGFGFIIAGVIDKNRTR